MHVPQSASLMKCAENTVCKRRFLCLCTYASINGEGCFAGHGLLQTSHLSVTSCAQKRAFLSCIVPLCSNVPLEVRRPTAEGSITGWLSSTHSTRCCHSGAP
eukprot:1150529-Pelagomonas_calceolata.AAC.3